MILFETNAQNIGLEFTLELKNFVDDNFMIISDKERIQQVVLNLLSNAFKFTKQGFIKIIVENID